MVGSGVVTSDRDLGGVTRFTIPGIGIAGVGASQALNGFITPVRRSSGGINTGIAIHNTESQSVSLDISLRSSQGEQVANGTKTIEGLPPGGHLAQFIDELFPLADTSDFEGTLVVQASNGTIAATALELGSEKGQFTTLPVTPLQPSLASASDSSLSAPLFVGKGDVNQDTGIGERLSAKYSQLPISFELNQGQADPGVDFLSRGRGFTLFLSAGEGVVSLGGSAVPTLIRMQVLGSNPDSRGLGVNELSGRSHYFIGDNPKSWHREVRNYARVKYEDVYPGVDLVYHGNQTQLEYDFIVAPGADPEMIRLGFQGIDSLEVDSAGDLVLYSSTEQLRLHKPVIYQELGRDRQQVSGGYVLEGGQQIGFHLGSYDPARPLVLDPVLTYSVSFGSFRDRVEAVAVDPQGNAYLTGSTRRVDFPTTPDALQGSLSGRTSAFVTKFSAAGDGLIYSTYIGGSSSDAALGISVDASGNTYLIGDTDSTDFPTMNPLQATPGGGSRDAFVAKLDPTGSALVYSTYLGGSDRDRGGDIALDSQGNTYVTGFTSSTDFPTANAVQPVIGGSTDAFVAKLDASGSELIYSTYLGGNLIDSGRGIAADGDGNAYLTGITDSTDFPAVSPFQSSLAGSFDTFVSKLDPTGSELVYSTYLGGSGSDFSSDIAVDMAGNAYLAGSTGSTNFPTANPFQPAFSGNASLKSSDGGESWRAIDAGLTSTPVYAVAVAPSNPSILYAAVSGGVFKSIDGGEEWNRANAGLPFGPFGNALAIDPSTSSTVYAGTERLGVFRSTDGGEEWSAINDGLPAGSIVDALAIDPTTPSTLYAGLRPSGPAEGGVFVSTDGGENWVASLAVNTVSVLAIDPVTPTTVYAGTRQGLFKQTQEGWSEVDVSVLNTSNSLPSVTALALDPAEPSTIYVSFLFGLFKSTDGGQSWTDINIFTRFATASNVLVIDPINPSTLYATSSYGVFKSINGGEDWNPTRGGLVNLRYVNTLAIDPMTPSTLYAGANPFTDAFVSKLDPTGSELVYSTYLGGTALDDSSRSGSDGAAGIAVDASGHAYVTGSTDSDHFPTPNLFQSGLGGSRNSLSFSRAFATKFSPNGSSLVYSFYSENSGRGHAVTVDRSGNAYVTGSMSPHFPNIDPALEPGDIFLLKLGETPRKIYVAQLGNGQGFTSDTVLTNPSAVEMVFGRVDFLDDEGLPLPIGIVATENPVTLRVTAPTDSGASVDFSIPPLGAITISTDGQGDLVVGSAVVTSDRDVGGVTRFSIPGIAIAGVGSSEPLQGFITPVRRESSGINTGVAIHNTGNDPVSVTLTLRDQQGQVVPGGTANIDSLPANGHLARFINELFPNAETDDFSGTLVVQVDGGSVAATALELGTETGEFTTLPVTSLH